MSAEALRAARRIVVKTGSSLVADGSAPRTGWLASLAADIAGLRAGGKEVILVSSGAVALGRGALGGAGRNGWRTSRRLPPSASRC